MNHLPPQPPTTAAALAEWRKWCTLAQDGQTKNAAIVDRHGEPVEPGDRIFVCDPARWAGEAGTAQAVKAGTITLAFQDRRGDWVFPEFYPPEQVIILTRASLPPEIEEEAPF